MNASPASHDALFGLVAVARFAGLSVEDAKRLAEAGELPVFDIGTMVCGSKVALRAWCEARERGEAKP